MSVNGRRGLVLGIPVDVAGLGEFADWIDERGRCYVPGDSAEYLATVNLDFLATLPEREWTCGLAEMFKHGCLEQSGRVLEELLANAGSLRDPTSPALARAILDSAGVKAEVVSRDEREGGLRAILNLGHTTAHALESLTGYKRFSHGEAVARGLATALLLSQRLAGLAGPELERLLEAMATMGLPRDTAGASLEDVWEHMKFDKKSEQGAPRFVLLRAPGDPVYGQPVELADFAAVWNEQRERFG